jgi:hypothetical protein
LQHFSWCTVCCLAVHTSCSLHACAQLHVIFNKVVKPKFHPNYLKGNGNTTDIPTITGSYNFWQMPKPLAGKNDEVMLLSHASLCMPLILNK